MRRRDLLLASVGSGKRRKQPARVHEVRPSARRRLENDSGGHIVDLRALALSDRLPVDPRALPQSPLRQYVSVSAKSSLPSSAARDGDPRPCCPFCRDMAALLSTDLIPNPGI